MTFWYNDPILYVIIIISARDLPIAMILTYGVSTLGAISDYAVEKYVMGIVYLVSR